MKTERCKDVVGRKVRLLREIQTRGGRVFPAGTVMTVDGTWRGKFDLRDDERSTEGNWCGVLKVRRCNFELVACSTDGLA